MLNPNYVVGFVDGEGCFCITINKNGNRVDKIQALKHGDSLDALDAHVQWGATEIT